MPQAFEVVSADGESSLHLRPHNRDYFVAELRGVRIAAEGHVGTYMAAGFAELFADMAANWRGWSDNKGWRSLEGELQLSAEADRAGHVTLRVDLCDGAPPVWCVTLHLALESGQLEQIAREARAFDRSVLGAV